ncbi:MAG TPA: hypothetical protein VGE74_00900 [Gemmata sp.]
MTGPTFATHAPALPPKAPRPAPKLGEKPEDAAGARILIYLRLHWLMIVFCGTLLGGAGAAAAWELLASKFESYGLFQVSSVPIGLTANNPQQARTDFSTYVKTQSTLIKSEFVLNAALRDIKDLPTIKAQKDPIKYLEEELMVSWQDGSEVIRVTFKGAEPEDARKIVNAVQKAFMEQVVERKVRENRDIVDKVEAAQNRMKAALEGRQKSKSASGTPGVLPVGGTGAGAPGAPGATPAVLPQDLIMHKLDPGIWVRERLLRVKEIEKLGLEISRQECNEAILKQQLDMIQKTPVPKYVEDNVEKDPDVIAATRNMMESFRLWKRVEGTSTNPNLPAIVEKRHAYEADKRHWEELKTEKVKTIEGARKLAEANKVAPTLQAVVNSIQQLKDQLEKAKEGLARADKMLLELPAPVEKSNLVAARFDKEYRPGDSDLEMEDGVFRELVRRYHLAKLEVESPPRVSVLQPASAPTQKDTKKQVMGTAFASVMGFVLMALGVVGFETVARRVSSLADVKAAVPAPVVGVVPGLPNDAAGRDPVRRAATNEAIDKLRAYVSQTWLSRGATTIAVTSAIGDEGKAFAAFGLASSLAQAGYKTLLVDFDLREPAIHPYAGVQNIAGVCELLRSETDMRSVVQFLPNGLHLLPAGKWSDEARKAATGEKLENVLAKMKEPYDCVVIHGHALLTVAESVEVARRCEVVLMCAKYRETATPLLKRAAERVATMEIPYSGVVYIGATEQEALC